MELISQDYILLIMNCKKYREKAQIQKDGWLRHLPNYLIYYHVLGNSDLDSDFEFDDVERILWVKTDDDYNSLPKKVINAYNAVAKTYNYKYIFKTDDDQDLTNIKFLDMVVGLINKSQDNKLHYGGNIVEVKQPYLCEYHRIHPELPKHLPVYPTRYCSGRFYFLSKEAVKDLLRKKNFICDEYLEDYAIGFHLGDIFKTHMKHLVSDNFFKDYSTS